MSGQAKKQYCSLHSRFLRIALVGLGISACVEQDKPSVDFGVNTGPLCEGAQPLWNALDPRLLAAFETCCEDTGHWIPSDLVPESHASQLQARPDNDLLCVPDLFLLDPAYQPPTCESVAGFEGRCASICAKRVQAELDFLPQDLCPEHERCAPCFDPRTQEDTQVCRLGFCDEPQEGPRGFEACGAAAGDAFCVPQDLVPDENRHLFDNKGCGSGCSNPDYLCVPRKIMDAGVEFSPVECEVPMAGLVAFFVNLLSMEIDELGDLSEYQEGRCIPQCIPDARDNGALFGQVTCDVHEYCLPCLDPRVPGEKVPTGACDF
jgi:hypothetical protein